MEKQKYYGRYRIDSARATWWEYDSNGAYFVTINTLDRHPYFGEINDGKMDYYVTGIVADVLWRQIPLLNPDWSLGEYVIMPDHMHGILFKDGKETLPINDWPDARPRNIKKNSLSSVVGSFKGAVTKNMKHLGYDFGWQPRFHERIIRDDHHLATTTIYIRNNVTEWWKKHGGGMG